MKKQQIQIKQTGKVKNTLGIKAGRERPELWELRHVAQKHSSREQVETDQFIYWSAITLKPVAVFNAAAGCRRRS